MRERLFLFLARLTYHYPVVVLAFWTGAAALGLLLASQLQMRTGRTDLLSPENKHVRNYTNFTSEFGNANNIYFIIESSSLREAKECADALAFEIEKHPAYIRDVLYKLDLDAVESKIFLHLSAEQLMAIEHYLEENIDFLEKTAAAKSLVDIFSAIGELAEERGHENFRHPATAKELGALAGLLEAMNSYHWEDERSVVNFLPVVAAGSLPFGVSDDPEGYLVGKNRRTVILAARPNAEKEDSLEFLKPMMEALAQARADVLERFPGVSIGMTGLATFAYGDLRVMEEEMPKLFLLALITTIILFLLFFRHPIEIAFAGFSMLLALACTLGAARILIGHLNIMSSVFAITMVSLGIDFGVHFIARLHNELSGEADFYQALQKTFAGAGSPIATGAMTTSSAFFVLYFTDFRGLAELGVIAGTGILFCLAAMLTVLPALIVLYNRRRPISPRLRGKTEIFFERVVGWIAAAAGRYAGAIAGLAAAATLFFCYFAPQVSFDYNFLHIQPKSSTTADYEEVLMERTGLAPSFNVIVAADLPSLQEKTERLRNFPSVARVDSASDLFPVNQDNNVEAIGRIRNHLDRVEQRLNRNHSPENLFQIVEQFETMKDGLGRALKMKSLFGDQEAVRQLERAKKAVEMFLRNYEVADQTTVLVSLQEFSRDFFSYLQKQVLLLNDERQLEEVRLSDYPENIGTRFVGRTGKFSAYVFPSQSIWNKDFLDRFNADTLEVAPDAAGTALFAQSILESAGRALRQSVLLIFVVIVALVSVDFRKAVPAALSLLSVVLGLIWMLGLMRLLDWQYNPINMMAVPVMLGIGIDNGVHIVHRYLDSGRNIGVAVRTSGRAVLVSSLTTIAGFSCLLLSTHRGLISLAQLLVLGMSACLIAALVVLPAVLHSIGTGEGSDS